MPDPWMLKSRAQPGKPGLLRPWDENPKFSDACPGDAQEGWGAEGGVLASELSRGSLG